MGRFNNYTKLGSALLLSGLLSGCASTNCQPSLSVENDVVIDKKTNLMWTKYDTFSRKTSGLSGGWIDWNSAIKTASTIDLNGYTDWRVPSTEN